VLASSWALSVLIWLPIAAIFALGMAAWAIFSFRYARQLDEPNDRYSDGTGWRVGAWATVATLVLFIGANALAFYPWHKEYHYWQTETGVVESVGSRVLGNSDGFEQKFVVRFTDGRERGCQDTRCVLIKPGDTLTMDCKRVWQFVGQDGWDCKYVNNRREAA
jgi:hypothetical protein